MGGLYGNFSKTAVEEFLLLLLLNTTPISRKRQYKTEILAFKDNN